jgi:outer membrane lipoprotein SlyB
MKKLYLILATFIIIINLSVTGCAILSHEKSYHQTVTCKDGKPVVNTYYGTDTEYMKIKRTKDTEDCDK